MDGRIAACDAPESPCRLLVHAEAPPARSALARALHRLRTHLSGAARGVDPLSLRVDDLHGRRVAEVGHAGPSTRIGLAAGTYVVTATRGAMQRGYTLTLDSGQTIDLHLHFGPGDREATLQARCSVIPTPR